MPLMPSLLVWLEWLSLQPGFSSSSSSLGILAPTVVPFSVFDTQAAAIAAKTGSDILVDIGVAAILIVVGAILLGLELRRLTVAVTPGMLLLRSDSIGSVRMALDSIRELAEMAGAGSREVRNIRCGVRVVKGGLRLRCTVALLMGCDVSSVSAKVQKDVLETVERLTGVDVIEVSDTGTLLARSRPSRISEVKACRAQDLV